VRKYKTIGNSAQAEKLAQDLKNIVKSSQGHGLSSPCFNGLENPFSFLGKSPDVGHGTFENKVWQN
jgi:hypothetical protein